MAPVIDSAVSAARGCTTEIADCKPLVLQTFLKLDFLAEAAKKFRMELFSTLQDGVVPTNPANPGGLAAQN